MTGDTTDEGDLHLEKLAEALLRLLGLRQALLLAQPVRHGGGELASPDRRPVLAAQRVVLHLVEAPLTARGADLVVRPCSWSGTT